MPDDSGCDTSTLSADCGLYADVFCTGETVQGAGVCLTECTTHADCDDTAFCNPNSSECELKLNDGVACENEDDAWCVNDHCQNGFCCLSGDCCSISNFCPSSYSGVPVCTSPSTCQGIADLATCENSTCGTLQGAAHDIACTDIIEADDCGPYLSDFCTGEANQDFPECATFCLGDFDCDPDAHCDATDVCVPD
jgi:hypothetical protein